MKTGIYVAGPMTGLPEFNFPAFHSAAARLRDVGWEEVGNPAEWDEANGLDTKGLSGHETPGSPALGTFDLAEALKMDLSWIADNAAAVALLPGWEKSKGTAAEVALAKALGLEVRPVDGFILLEGDRVWVVKDAKRSPLSYLSSGEESASISDCYARVIETVDDELELLVETEDGSKEAYVRIQDVLPATAKPVSVADLHKTFTTFTEVEDLLADVADVLGNEVRVTSATGGQKGKKLAELGTVDPLALLTLAEVSGFGAQKYAAFNYLKGYDWSLSFNALTRHLLAFWNGEDNDPESGLPHITHAAWHALALTSFFKRGLGTDDRFKQEEAA